MVSVVFSMCKCVYVHACVRCCVCRYACVYVWRLKVDIRCLLCSLSTLYMEATWTQSLPAWLVYVTSWLQGSQSLPPKHCCSRWAPHPSSITQTLLIRAVLLMLTYPHLSPQPRFYFYKKSVNVLRSCTLLLKHKVAPQIESLQSEFGQKIAL